MSNMSPFLFRQPFGLPPSPREKVCAYGAPKPPLSEYPIWLQRTLSLGESNTDSPSAVLFCSFVFVLLALRCCIVKVFYAALAEGRV